MNGTSTHRPFCLPPIDRLQTKNRLPVFFASGQKLPLVGIHLIYPIGAEADPPGKAGLADLAAEMLTLGTKKESASQLAERVDRMGALLSAHAGWDYSSLHVLGLKEDFPSLLGLLKEVYTEPAFSAEEFEQLRQRRLALLTQQKDESSIQADERFAEILFRGTPYDHPIYGSLQTIPSISVEEARAFHQTHFLPAGSFLVVTGEVPKEETLGWIEEYFPRIEREKPEPAIDFSLTPSPGIRTFLLNRKDLTQSQIRIGHLGMAHAHPDFVPFEVMNYVLGGGGFSSRLMQRIRVERGYTYGIRGSMEPRKNLGPLTIATFTPTETTVPCVKEIFTVLRSFLEQGPEEAERAEAIQFLTGSYPLRFETSGQVAQKIIQAQVHGLGLEFLSTYPQRVREVSLAKMIQCARTHIHPERMNLVIVGRIEAFQRDLEPLGPVEITE